MIICSTCHQKEMQGALFCSQCGGNLVHKDDNAIIDSSLSLYLIDHDQELPLTDMEKITLGRHDEGQSIISDVDLSAHQAFDQGVSRLHAIIKFDQEMTITDLGSSNGTFINGEKVEAYIPHPIVFGDLLTLGKMKLTIVIRN
jgi:DnaJ-class molecular chaperone